MIVLMGIVVIFAVIEIVIVISRNRNKISNRNSNSNSKRIALVIVLQTVMVNRVELAAVFETGIVMVIEKTTVALGVAVLQKPRPTRRQGSKYMNTT